MAIKLGKEMLYLSRADVERCAVTAKEMNAAQEAMFAAKAAGTAATKPKLAFFQPGGRSFRAKAGVMETPPYAGIKWFGYFAGNAARGVPDFLPLMIVNETETGLPVCVMDGSWLSGIRTASFSAVAAKRLARKEASSIGFVACGTQARMNLDTLAAEFPIRRIVCHSRRAETAERFAAEARAKGFEARVAAAPREAVEGQDIVVTSVPHTAVGDLRLDAAWLSPGGYAAMVDLGYSWDAKSIEAFNHVSTDDHEQSAPGGPERLNYDKPYDSEIAELVAGTKIGRRNAKERTALIFSGIGLGDVAASALIYERAVEKGIGQVLAL